MRRRAQVRREWGLPGRRSRRWSTCRSGPIFFQSSRLSGLQMFLFSKDHKKIPVNIEVRPLTDATDCERSEVVRPGFEQTPRVEGSQDCKNSNTDNRCRK